MSNIVSQHQLLFNPKPLFSSNSAYQEHTYTGTIKGYLYEAKKRTRQLKENRKLIPYKLFLTIYIRQQQNEKQVSETWNKATRKFRKHGIVAYWEREPTKSNKVHYHLIVCNDISKTELSEIVEKCMPSRKVLAWHKNIKLVDERPHLEHYITKAKIAGKRKNGKFYQDKYGNKRLLFKKGLRIQKNGTINKFWQIKPDYIWKEIIKTEKRIHSDPRTKSYARYICDLIGDERLLKRIERNYGYFGVSDKTKPVIDGYEAEEVHLNEKQQMKKETRREYYKETKYYKSDWWENPCRCYFVDQDYFPDDEDWGACSEPVFINEDEIPDDLIEPYAYDGEHDYYGYEVIESYTRNKQ